MQIPTSLKPFSFGAASGAILLSIVALNSGWAVTATSMNRSMDEAAIELQASICASRAEAHLKSSNSTVDLEGYRTEASEARRKLAESYAIALQGEEKPAQEVVSACDRMLNKPRT